MGCGEEINETFRTGQRGFLMAWSMCEAALGWPLVCCGWDGFRHSDGLWWLMVGVRMGDDVSTQCCCPSETRLSEGWCGIFLIIIFFFISMCQKQGCQPKHQFRSTSGASFSVLVPLWAQLWGHCVWAGGSYALLPVVIQVHSYM